MASRYKDFGRKIFSFYEKFPLTANSIVGGTVYATSEAVVQYQKNRASPGSLLDKLDTKKVAHIGVLGACENGILMTTWYNILTKLFGSGVGTNIVLVKCFCDQIFFATQQDGLFLALCAYEDSDALPQAIEEVKRSFLNTWIADCSVWPVVNFFGK